MALNPINEAFNAVVNTRPVLDRVVQNKAETSKLEIRKEEISTDFVKEEPKLGEAKSTPESSEKSFFDLD